MSKLSRVAVFAYAFLMSPRNMERMMHPPLHIMAMAPKSKAAIVVFLAEDNRRDFNQKAIEFGFVPFGEDRCRTLRLPH